MSLRKKILVTGGAGFVGSHLVDELIKRGNEVKILDNLDEQVHPGGKRPDYLHSDAEFIHGDVRDYELFKKALQDTEIIYHQAAVVGVGQSQYQIKRYIDTNVGGTANLLDIIVNHKHHVEKIIIAASMSSYGEGSYHCPNCGSICPETRGVDQLQKKRWEIICHQCNATAEPLSTPEEKLQKCTSIYAQSKKGQEEMALTIGQAFGIPMVILRYFNIFGPRQSLSNPYTGVVAIFSSRLKNDNAPVIYEDGMQMRDFVSVRDIVQANLLSMEKKEANNKVFNVGTGKSITIKKVAETVSRLLKKNIRPKLTNFFRKGDIRHCYADITRIQKALGYMPTISFEEGMQELVEWSKSVQAEDKFDMANQELIQRGLL